jgi:hypothetical protein
MTFAGIVRLMKQVQKPDHRRAWVFAPRLFQTQRWRAALALPSSRKPSAQQPISTYVGRQPDTVNRQIDLLRTQKSFQEHTLPAADSTARGAPCF